VKVQTDHRQATHYNYFRDYDPSLGRYVESDPIGLRGALNTYAYVKNNPLHSVDPRGLVNWKGVFGGGAVASGVGGGVFGFDLTSECKCGRQIRIRGFASALTAGFGLKDETGSGSVAEFYDYYECPQADAANGLFSMSSANLVVGTGPGYSDIKLGALRSYSNLGDQNYGLDVSIGIYLGASAVVQSEVTQCCGRK